MPIRRRSAARAGPMLGSCSSRSHSSALFAFGDLITMTPSRSHQHVVADQADGEALDREAFARADDYRLELGVLGDELDPAAGALEALDGDIVAEAGDDDLAGLRLARLLHGEQVAVHDAGVLHAHAAHLEQVVGA